MMVDEEFRRQLADLEGRICKRGIRKEKKGIIIEKLTRNLSAQKLLFQWLEVLQSEQQILIEKLKETRRKEE